MKNAIIGLALGLSIGAAIAQDNVTITPTYLYNKITALQKDEMRFRQTTNEQLDCAAKTVFEVNQLKYRIQELERKVAGVQKQVTILHAKKADK